jgi:histidinol-phosphate aminotransferase
VEIDLSDNTNQWGAHPAAVRSLQSEAGDGLARYPELYADVLRAAVSERLGVEAECVTTGCGSDDVLDSIYRAVRSADGDFVSVATPTFSMAMPLARMNGMEARAVPWPEALEAPERLLEGGPALVYVCRPNNPTGHVAPQAWLEALVAAAGSNGPVILVDEAYVDFADGSFAQAATAEPRVIVTRTLSKAFGLAGLRVGYAIASPATALEVEKSRGPYKVSRVAAHAAATALRDEEGWVTRTVAECLENRDRLHAALVDRGLDPQPSSANFIFFRALSADAGEDAQALRRLGVAVRPFPSAWSDGSDALRVTVGPWALMDRFLEALDEVMAS